MLDHTEIKRLHDKAYQSGQVTRERASDDLVFYWVTQWDDNLLGESQLQYRGEFNILRKAGRQIMSDLRANPVQVDFDPKNEDRDDAADFLDGLYRTTDRQNTSLEAYDNAAGEQIVCGVGAWLLYTTYESSRAGNENQVIKRRPIYEANNNVFWDPNAKLLDKSDAKYVSILWAYSEDGYKDLVYDLTGEEIPDGALPSFAEPEESYTFPWLGGEDRSIYVVEFYHEETVTDKILTLEDPIGEPIQLLDSAVEEQMDTLIDAGYRIVDERKIQRPQITKYIASGADILDSEVIAGEFIPVVPAYGERAFIEGEEHYEGVTRLAKDPSRLRNFQMSYLADIVSRSPRRKPIFNPEQVQGYEFMYEENGADNNFPYYLQNRTTAQGEPLPVGPVAEMPEQPIPQALAASIELTRDAVEDVANPGLPQDIADPDISGKAVLALQNRVDQQSMVYQQNMKHAKRRDGEIYASMASVIYDAPRTVTLTSSDGSRKQASVMEMVIDRRTGAPMVLNDITNLEFDVYADVGPSYTTKREQTMDKLGEMIGQIDPANPLREILMLKYLQLMDGVDFTDVRDFARRQLILQGIQEPETEEEQQMLMQAQQSAQDQQNPNMVLAQAEMLKGQAAMIKEQREAVKTEAGIMNDRAQTEIDLFEAQTNRQEADVAAAKAGAEINLKRMDAFTKRVEAAARLRGSAMPQRAMAG